MKFQQPKIAVVSLAGVFPGARDTDRFIDNILNKREAIGPVPSNRWTAPPDPMVDKSGRPDRAASDRAGLITDFAFDPHGFDLDPDLLAGLDPVHHLVLTAGRQLMKGCVAPDSLLDRTGVILAAIALPTERASLLAEKLLCHPDPRAVHPHEALGATVVSAPAAILARVLGCRGGSYTLDAACASSLFSIKLACEHLLCGKADMMIAGGVSRPDALYTQIGFTQLAALSPRGRCAPFDRHADGLVVGEGTGLVVLKRLEDAIDCGDTIHGVITGWGVSNDIQGNLVAPASEGQVRAMQAAYQMAGWSLSDIQYMECHGSGTPKGDDVELTSIRTLADQFGCTAAPLAIGSVKSMTGHLLTAAGAAGFIKTLLAMKACTLPPSLNFSQLPDRSPALGSGIRVQTGPEDWNPARADLPRRAGISAFGFGGINAHILVEAFKPASASLPRQSVPQKTPQPVPCAIVGMAVLGPDLETLEDLDRIISGQGTAPKAPGLRWRNPGADTEDPKSCGRYMETLKLDLKDFHIPPNQFPDILAQHLVMLKTARNALADAGIRPRPKGDDPLRDRMGAALGIDFDFGAADFFLRWHHHTQPDRIIDQISPPLTFDRTLGALGGIVASRIAREFKLGGPCFTLSAGPASGIKAVETGMLSLGAGETDIFLCGAVDMAGDLCAFSINKALGLFDRGILPSEGAAALVLKRLDRAVEDNDRIYAVIRGTGAAGGDGLAAETGQTAADADALLTRSLERALEASGTRHDALTQHFGPDSPHGKDGSIDPAKAIGHTGAASGLFSVAAASRVLYRSGQAPGLAAVGSLTPDGAAAHLILASHGGPGVQAAGNQDTEALSVSSREIAVPVAKPRIPMDILDRLHPPAPQAHPGLDRSAGTANGLPQESTDLLVQIHDTTARAHERFLDLSSRNLAEMGKQLAALAGAAPGPALEPGSRTAQEDPGLPAPPAAPGPQVFLNRDQCLEYARGKAGKVLGPAFDIIDTYPARVRLPDEPLMLVDRIMEIQGEMLSLTSGKIVTQHDVLENAWYLDGGKAPVSISIEAGQADLFLCAWLGIDHVVKGTRKYRLLDAKVTFHRSLPQPSETIEYHIEIDRFLRQGEIYLFFFHYKGYINRLPFISMRDGCAGFFTDEEVKNSGGIILKKEEMEPVISGTAPAPLVPMTETCLSDSQVTALRCGDFETAFGPLFRGVTAGQHQWLPGGPMTLIHRVLALEPAGGRYGMGRIVAEADIHPDDWFLTCHFIDDMVMPGTLMYECCAHALRIFIQRLGWISPSREAHYDVLPANESDLKCRGPVTPQTVKARYEIEIKEMGYGPEPFVKADAHMFSDDLQIVLYKDMGMKLAGVTHRDLMDFWRKE